VAQHAEWQQQVLLSKLLDRWLDPACSVWTATDPVASSATAGAMRKKRGVQAGVPDTLVWYRGKSITIEMKSPGGKTSDSQRAFRERLLRARVRWWVCCSANAAMVALRRSGVRFREIIREDGRVERWKEPWLASWEIPRADPSESRPWHPKVNQRRRAARQRWLARKRERETQLAAARCQTENVDVANSEETGTQLRPARQPSMPTAEITSFPEGKRP
jgi:VRR-NUC domain